MSNGQSATHIALLKMCQQEEHFFTGIDKLFTYESIMISDFTNCNQLMAFLTFYGITNIDSNGCEPCGWELHGDIIQYIFIFMLPLRQGQLCGRLLLIEHFPCIFTFLSQEQVVYMCFNLAKYDLFFFPTKCCNVSLACLFVQIPQVT